MVNLPISIEVVVLQAVAQQTGMPQSIFQVISAAPRVWSRSNLGLNCYRAGHSGDRFLIPGWSVQVTDGMHHWFYRVDTAGRTVRFDPTVQIGSASAQATSANGKVPISMGTRNTGSVGVNSVATNSVSPRTGKSIAKV